MRIAVVIVVVGCVLVLGSSARAADPAVPSGAHPRLFMSAPEIAAYTANAANAKSEAAAQIAACQDTLDEPAQYQTRGGGDGNYWPAPAVACAFAWRATGQQKYLTQALLYWQASLSDDQNLGDKLGCVAGVDTNWQTWAMKADGSPAPPVILTITHDTDYPMRWYGPDIALTYDWLYSAPGVTPALLAQTRTCLTNWLDFYSGYGYHHDQAGANYNAGFVVAKALAAVAIGNDGGADGHLWTQALDDQFATLLVGDGLKGAGTGVGTAAGAMLGGDWLEGWQYGELSVLEYAFAARALEANGASLPALDAWTDSLMVRYIHAQVPTLDGQWVGGDFDSTAQIYQSPSTPMLDAVLGGPSSDQAASWAAYLKKTQQPSVGGFIYDAIAEVRSTTPADYRAQSPAPPRWYLSRGSRAIYARTGWDATAFWGVFSSAPHIVDDHEHFASSNFVFSRGADHLLVDTSEYGAENTLETNALSADSPAFTGDYAETQGPWSQAELTWARATDDNVFAARSDLAKAFIFSDNPSDIPYAHREWVFLPEGEMVTIDRVHTADAAHVMRVNFHANTNGTLALSGSVASGTVGGSSLAIHAVNISGGTPSITQPAALSDDYSKCPGNYPYGPCTDARLKVDIYALQVPGPHAMAIHVLDGLGASETATVASMNDATIDPGAAQNTGVIGAAVLRAAKQSYVVASSAQDGATAATMSYGVPGATAARHIVFDAPEATDGSSHVAAAAAAGRCVVTITAGAGAGFSGHPLMFSVDSAANGCAVTDGTDAPSAVPPGGGGIDGGTGGGGGGGGDGGITTNNGDGGGPTNDGDDMGAGGTASHKSGCSCSIGGAGDSLPPFGLLLAIVGVLLLSRRRYARSSGSNASSTRERGR